MNKLYPDTKVKVVNKMLEKRKQEKKNEGKRKKRGTNVKTQREKCT